MNLGILMTLSLENASNAIFPLTLFLQVISSSVTVILCT